MKWIFQVSTENISEYFLLSAEGEKCSFKYSRLQQSIRIKYQDQRAVFLLDKNSFSTRKSFVRNVYGSEIGTIVKSLLNDQAGTITMLDAASKFHYKILTRENAVLLSNGGFSALCQVDENDAKAHEEFYMLAVIVLSWMYTLPAPVKSKRVARY